MVEKRSEAQIISGLKSNDSRICRHLFEEYFTPLLYFAGKIIDDREEAEDIVIQVFNKFWGMRENFDSVAGIKAFLYIATRNACFNFIKHRKRKEERKKEFTSHLISMDQADEIERQVIESDFLNRIYHEVQNLPGKCRQVFLLTYFEGLSAREIAENLNITVSTVTTQRARALKYLKEILSPEDYFLLCCMLTGLSCQVRDIFLHSLS
jgi:RNA polymerase sigma-70 factor (ECF subfamily)